MKIAEINRNHIPPLVIAINFPKNRLSSARRKISLCMLKLQSNNFPAFAKRNCLEQWKSQAQNCKTNDPNMLKECLSKNLQLINFCLLKLFFQLHYLFRQQISQISINKITFFFSLFQYAIQGLLHHVVQLSCYWHFYFQFCDVGCRISNAKLHVEKFMTN